MISLFVFFIMISLFVSLIMISPLLAPSNYDLTLHSNYPTHIMISPLVSFIIISPYTYLPCLITFSVTNLQPIKSSELHLLLNKYQLFNVGSADIHILQFCASQVQTEVQPCDWDRSPSLPSFTFLFTSPYSFPILPSANLIWRLCYLYVCKINVQVEVFWLQELLMVDLVFHCIERLPMEGWWHCATA